MGQNKYLVIHGAAKDSDEAISMCGRALYDAGLVKRDIWREMQDS